MMLTLLGTGGPRPDPERQGPAALIQAAGTNLLVDCGRGVCTRLAQAGVRLTELDAVLLTHLHFDHVGDLADVIFAAWTMGRTESLPIIGPPGTDEFVDALFTDLYALDIDYRLREADHMGEEVAHPRDLVDIRVVTHGVAWDAGGVHAEARVVDHGDVLGLDQWTAVGYRFEEADRVIAISGDAVPCQSLTDLARGADILVQCCYLSDAEIDSPAAELLSRTILGGAPQAVETAVDAGVKTLVLTHLREKSDEGLAELHGWVSARFEGTVVIGHDLLTLGD